MSNKPMFTKGPWVKTADSLPKEYEEVYAKHEDGSIRIARLSKSEGGCWQLATFLTGTKRPGYAWPTDKVAEWRPIEPESTASIAAPELLAAAQRVEQRISYYASLAEEDAPNIEQWAYSDNSGDLAYLRAAIAKALGEDE